MSPYSLPNVPLFSAPLILCPNIMKRFHQLCFLIEEPIPSQSLIDEFEKKIGFNLPSDYRFFLEEVNGGAPNGNNFFTRNSESVCLQVFWPLLTLDFDNDEGLYGKYEDFKDEYEENELLPIGMDTTGEPICLSLVDPIGVVISLWELDEGLSISRLGTSFEAFVMGLDDK